MPIEQEINKIVGELLSAPHYYSKDKYINDPSLGTLDVRDYEQSIIDTPLYQRLRYIHQTGFTFLTFPTAQHTRFEHSLGVMTIATKLFQVLKEKHQSDYDNLTEDSLIRIRLAALLHDIGHSAFSHTSEEFYSNLKDIKDLIGSDKRYKGKGAGEVLSSLIISCASFQNFFIQLKELYPKLAQIDIKDVAALVTGKPKSDDYGYEADIISGPIDADKLDYFPRDGKAVGLDVSLDMHRLINCVELQEMPSFKNPGKKRRSLVINRRGYNALQQLLFARATLTATVYHHHKVRTCDAMLKNVMEAYNKEGANFRCCASQPEGISLNETPNFLKIVDYDFKSEINNLKKEDIKRTLLSDLFSRNLFKRILKISLQTVHSDAIDDKDPKHEEVKGELSAFTNLRKDAQAREALINEILKVCEDKAINYYQVAIDIPHRPNFDKAGTASINFSSSPKTPQIVTLKQVIPINDWITGYERFFGHAYLFGPADTEKRAQIAIAAATVLSKGGEDKILLKLKKEAITEDIRERVLEICNEKGLQLFV